MSANFESEEFKEYIDINTGLGRVRNNKSLYKRMLNLFLQSKELISFEEALASDERDQAAEFAHGIKGMTGNLGLDRIYKQSAELTEQLRKGIVDEALITDYRESLKVTQEYVREVIDTLE